MNDKTEIIMLVIFVCGLCFLLCFDKINSIKDRVERIEKYNRDLEKEVYDIKWKRKD